MISVFFSSAHEDEGLRNELEVHLSVLKQQGVISTWHDRQIHAGSEIDGAISKRLEEASVILLLVSPHFLASAYCNDIEVRRAMKRHEEGSATVIPVILHPCDWIHAPFGKLRACPKDGLPVSKHPNMHDAFLDITKSIREVVERITPKENQANDHFPVAAEASTTHAERSSNLRVRREFTDHETDTFLDKTFGYIAAFFENSLAELERRNPGTETRFVKRDAHRFTAAVYVRGEKRTSCSVWLGDETGFPGGICFSHSDSTHGTGYNESFSVTSDGYCLGLKPLGMGVRLQPTETTLTQQGAADYYWALLIESLQ